jgi:hypothetical protein
MQDTRNKTRAAKMKVIRRSWTDEEKETVVRMYPDHSTREIADLIGRKLSQVYQIADRLGLKKTEAYREQLKKEDGERLKSFGNKFRFKKGHVPQNKGKGMPEEVREKVKKTWFPKGHLPHNTNYDGHIRISKDGYQEIRVSAGRYRLLHLVNWEKINGRLPQGHCLWCLDGDKLNADPSNWELISRADNMRRNTVQRYPEEIREVIRMKAVLTRKINRYEKQD